MQIHIYIHIYIYIYMYKYIYLHVYAYTYIYIYTNTHTDIYIHIYVYIYIYLHIYQRSSLTCGTFGTVRGARYLHPPQGTERAFFVHSATCLWPSPRLRQSNGFSGSTLSPRSCTRPRASRRHGWRWSNSLHNMIMRWRRLLASSLCVTTFCACWMTSRSTG